MKTHTVQVYTKFKYEPRIVCCGNLAEAFQSGTDNEAYGKLAHTFDDDPTDDPTMIRIGSGLPSISFCPWCGTEMSKLQWTPPTEKP